MPWHRTQGGSVHCKCMNIGNPVCPRTGRPLRTVVRFCRLLTCAGAMTDRQQGVLASAWLCGYGEVQVLAFAQIVSERPAHRGMALSQRPDVDSAAGGVPASKCHLGKTCAHRRLLVNATDSRRLEGCGPGTRSEVPLFVKFVTFHAVREPFGGGSRGLRAPAQRLQDFRLRTSTSEQHGLTEAKTSLQLTVVASGKQSGGGASRRPSHSRLVGNHHTAKPTRFSPRETTKDPRGLHRARHDRKQPRDPLSSVHSSFALEA